MAGKITYPITNVPILGGTSGSQSFYNSEEKVVSGFSYVANGLEITFTDLSRSNKTTIKSWEWDFGDGNKSTLQNPVHTYATSDTFLVILKVVTSSAAEAESGQELTVSGSSGFEMEWTTPSNGQSITLGLPEENDAMTYTYVYNFNVDWGDGQDDDITAFDDAARAHTYATAGTYTVSITGTIEAYSNVDILAGGGGPTDYRPWLDRVTNWGPNQWKSLKGAFAQCTNLTEVPATAPDLTQIEFDGLDKIFQLASSFNSGIDNWDITGVTQLEECFSDATAFNQPLNSWSVNTSITSLFQLFRQASSFNQPLSSWIVDDVIDMNSTFYISGFAQDLSSWNVSNVTDMSFMFQGPGAAGSLGISGWDVSSVTTLERMFANRTGIVDDLTGWTTTAATIMTRMFDGSDFDQDISGWDMNGVLNVERMFAFSNFNSPLNGWDVSTIESMQNLFLQNPTFNQSLSSWVVTSVTGFSGVFFGATAFNQPLNTWDVSAGENFSGMFHDATSFNQSLSTWNTSNSTSYFEMFDGATSFDQDISNFDFSDDKSPNNMFLGATLSISNYNALLVKIAADNYIDNTVSFSGGNSQYTDTTSHDYITGTMLWSVTDGGTPP